MRSILPFVYLPAIVLIASRILMVASGRQDGALLSRAVDLLDRAEPVYLFGCAAAAIVVLARAFSEITSLTGRRQLRWLAWGTVLGVGPFALGYALPWSLGVDPPIALQLTAVPLSVVPLTFASAIVRYRLRDIEVIIKRALTYTAFLAASALLYVFMQQLVEFMFANDSDPHNSIVAVLATAVVVLLAQPVKEAVQNALDRVFYRDRYDYRRALVAFARDLNSDLDVVRLSQRLVSRIVETLVLDRMALMLADERLGDFRAIGDFGFVRPVPRLTRASTLTPRLDARPHRRARRSDRRRPVRRRRGGVLARSGHLLLRAVHFRRRRDRRPRARAQRQRRAVQQRGSRAADRRRRAGGDGDRKRPALPAASPEGRGDRPDARVQREHPRVARRRAGGVRRVGADRPLEPRARVDLRRGAGRCGRPAAVRDLRRAVRGGAAGGARGEPARRHALQGAADQAARERGDRGRHDAPARQRHGGAAAELSRRCVHRHHPPHRGHHRSDAPRRAAADLGKDGVDRPARGRRRPRSEHAADRNLELHADAAGRRRSGRSEDGAAREDRAPDVPRRQDRQRAAHAVPARARRAARAPTSTSTASSPTCSRCSSTSSKSERSGCGAS